MQPAAKRCFLLTSSIFREIDFIFGADGPTADLEGESNDLLVEHTLAGVKATALGAHGENIEAIIAAHGFEIVSRVTRTLEDSDSEVGSI